VVVLNANEKDCGAQCSTGNGLYGVKAQRAKTLLQDQKSPGLQAVGNCALFYPRVEAQEQHEVTVRAPGLLWMGMELETQ